MQSARIQKTSIAEKLDVLASAINEMKVDTERTAQVIPQIMGDETALETANAEAEAGAIAPGIPPEEEGMEGEDIMNEEELPLEEGGVPDTPMPGAEDMMPPEEEPAPPVEDMGGEMGGAYGGEEEEDYLSDEDLEALLAEIYDSGDGYDEPMGDVPAVGSATPEVPMSGGAGLADATNNLLAALKQAAHEAIDNNDIDRVVELSHIEQQIMQTLSGEVGLMEADTTTGPEEAMMEAPEDEVPGDLPFEPEAAPVESEDAESALAEEENDAEDYGGDEEESEGEADDEDEGEDEDEEDDSESTKKSMSADCDVDDEESFEKGDDMEDPLEDTNLSLDAEPMEKSYVPPSPSFRDMLDNKLDMVAFMKGNAEGYIDEAEIFADPEVDAFSGGVDGPKAFMKHDDRIASARSIFDMPMSRSGHTDPASIATAGEAQEALDHTGSQNPDSISTADEIINVSKSAEDIGEISASSGSTDPDSIASAGTAQEALSHTGTQDPDSIADAEKAVEPGTGNESEGEKKSVDISIEKSEGMSEATFGGEIAESAGMEKSMAGTPDIPGAYRGNPMYDEGGATDFSPEYGRPDLREEDEGLGFAHTPRMPSEVYGTPMAGPDGMVKSAPGKHMMTFREMVSIAKSDKRPNMASSMGADLSRPELDRITKSTSTQPVVRMGRGVDPMKVIENDLNEWNIYKGRNKF